MPALLKDTQTEQTTYTRLDNWSFGVNEVPGTSVGSSGNAYAEEYEFSCCGGLTYREIFIGASRNLSVNAAGQSIDVGAGTGAGQIQYQVGGNSYSFTGVGAGWYSEVNGQETGGYVTASQVVQNGSCENAVDSEADAAGIHYEDTTQLPCPAPVPLIP